MSESRRIGPSTGNCSTKRATALTPSSGVTDWSAPGKAKSETKVKGRARRSRRCFLRSSILTSRSEGESTGLDLTGSLFFLDRDLVDYAGLLFVPIMIHYSGERVCHFVDKAKVVCDRYNILFPVTLLNFTTTALYFNILIILFFSLPILIPPLQYLKN